MMNRLTLKTHQTWVHGSRQSVLHKRPCNKCSATDGSNQQETQPKKPSYINEYKAWGVRVIESDEVRLQSLRPVAVS